MVVTEEDRNPSEGFPGCDSDPDWIISSQELQRQAHCPWRLLRPLALLVVTAFAPVIGNGFVNWDDYNNFLWNPHYRGVGWPQLHWAWTNYWLGVYQPLAWMLLEVQYVLSGLDPRGYHLVSVALHTAISLLLYKLCVMILLHSSRGSTRRPSWNIHLGSALAAGLFAVHPLRAEVVAWASCQPYLPCALFSILAVMFYLRAYEKTEATQLIWLAGAWVSLACALLCKAVALSLPAVLLMLDFYPIRRLKSSRAICRAFLEKLPLFALSLIIATLAVRAKQHSQEQPLFGTDLSSRVAQACYGVWFYLVKTALPIGLTAFYPLPKRVSLNEPLFLMSLVGVVGVSAWAIWMRHQRPGFLAVWVSYLIIVSPNLGFARIGDYVAADRYSYVASIGWFIMLAYGLSWLPDRGRQGHLCLAVVVAVTLILTAMTWRQCMTWRTSESLWANALAHGSGKNAEVNLLMGTALDDQGRSEEALVYLQRSLELQEEIIQANPKTYEQDPMMAGILNNISKALTNLSLRGADESYRRSVANYHAALECDPRPWAYLYLLNNHYVTLARMHRQAGRLADASAITLELERLWPDDPMRLYQASSEHVLCMSFVFQDRSRLSIEERKEALRYTARAMQALYRAAAAAFRDFLRPWRTENMLWRPVANTLLTGFRSPLLRAWFWSRIAPIGRLSNCDPPSS
jgi:hypothetical protein